MTRNHPDPNVYYIRPVGGTGEFPANRRQLRDLGRPATASPTGTAERLSGSPQFNPVHKPVPKPRYNLRQRLISQSSNRTNQIQPNSMAITPIAPKPAPRYQYEDNSILVTKL